MLSGRLSFTIGVGRDGAGSGLFAHPGADAPKPLNVRFRKQSGRFMLLSKIFPYDPKRRE